MEIINLEKLTKLGEKWLEGKIQRMKNLLKITEPDDALYREIMLSLGYPRNRVQFLELALMLPFKEIKTLKEKNIIEKALLYRAGLSDDEKGLPDNFDFSLRMDKSVWNFNRIRPVNYPDKRIKGISFLLAEVSNNGLVNFFIKKIKQEIKEIKTKKEAKDCVEKIMDFQGIGNERKREMFFNIILPFLIAYYENKDFDIIQFLNKIFDIHPSLSENSITKTFRKSISKDFDYSTKKFSVKTYFGMHYYIKEFKR